MKKSQLLVVFLLALMFSAQTGYVFAEEDLNSDSGSIQEVEYEENVELEEEIEDEQNEVRTEKLRERAEKQIEIEEKRAEYQLELKERAEEREEERTKKTAELQEERAQKKSELEEEREKNKIDREEEFKQRISERLVVFSENLTEKTGKYYERLSQLSEKLATRIVELEAKGVDVSSAKAQLDEADALLESGYVDALVLIDSISDYDLTDRESFGEVVSQVSELKNPFRDVLTAYKEVVTELKVGVENAREDGTSTSSTGLEE